MPPSLNGNVLKCTTTSLLRQKPPSLNGRAPVLSVKRTKVLLTTSPFETPSKPGPYGPPGSIPGGGVSISE